MRLFRRLIPRKSEVWRPFAEELGGQYVEGRFWTADRLEFTHSKSIIRFTAERDHETGSWATCVRSLIEASRDVSISLMKNWPGQQLFNALGLFDFMASATDQKKTSLADVQIEGEGFLLSRGSQDRLFETPELRAAISRQTQLLLLIGEARRYPFARGGKRSELTLLVPRIISQTDQLTDLLRLHIQLIETLFATGIVPKH